MSYSVARKQKGIEIKMKRRFKKYEKLFSVRGYNGIGKNVLKDIPGASDIIIVSPYSVNCYDTEKIRAHRFTGALTRLLAHETGCRAISVQKSFDKSDREAVKRSYMDRIGGSGANILVELRVNAVDTCAVKVGECGYIQDKGNHFLPRLAQYVLEYEYRDFEEIDKIVEICTYMQNTILSETAKELKIPVLIVDINESILGLQDLSSLYMIYSALKRIVALVKNIDLTAEGYDVYRVWQAGANSHIPQDKIEFVDIESTPFSENAFLHVSSFEGMHETVRVNKINDKTLVELNEYLSQHLSVGKSKEYVILTNRLIETLFGREWLEGVEELPGLRSIPIIVYENKREEYEIGIPKADRVNDIALTTALYTEKLPLSSKYDYFVFNRYSDSRISIKVENADYQDNGRVKSKDGIFNAKKIMLPRYYRLMMGYIDKPLKIIRAEEYRKMINTIPEKNEVMENTNSTLKYEVTKEDFANCYHKMQGQAYYQLIEENDTAFEDEVKLSLYIDSKERITRYFGRIGVYSHIDLIRVPKKIKQKMKIHEKLFKICNKVYIKVLKIMIGKAEYILKTGWAGETDDKNNVARLNNNMMSLLGVSENDRILIRFGENVITQRVLPKDDLTDYEIGIPASGRRALGMNSINDIVVVHRDMVHTLKRHSQEQTLAILGSLLTVVQAITALEIFANSLIEFVIIAIVCILAVIFMLYFILSEERVKVK